MKQLSISTLYPKTKFKKDSLSTNSLLDGSRLDNTLPYFNIDALIEERKSKKHEVKDIYRKFLSLCMEKIKELNSREHTDFVFNVPPFIYLCPKYNSHECLRYIEVKLRNKYIDTLILSNCDIFVSWLYAEQNKKILGK